MYNKYAIILFTITFKNISLVKERHYCRRRIAEFRPTAFKHWGMRQSTKYAFILSQKISDLNLCRRVYLWVTKIQTWLWIFGEGGGGLTSFIPGDEFHEWDINLPKIWICWQVRSKFPKHAFIDDLHLKSHANQQNKKVGCRQVAHYKTYTFFSLTPESCRTQSPRSWSLNSWMLNISTYLNCVT